VQRTAKGLETHGAIFLIDDTGKLKHWFDLDLTPQTIDALGKSEQRRQIAATLTTGHNLLRQLRDSPDSVEDIRILCDAASDRIKKEYIVAVYFVFSEGERGRVILQQMVNYATGVGESADRDERGDFARNRGLFSRRDLIDQSISYLAKALDLRPRGKDDLNGRPHPAIEVLEMFARSLPRGVSFEIVPTPTRRKKTLEEKLARPLSKGEQAMADAIKDRLFGPG
jgi:hypothetical protein